jgi:hypothetical protein
MISANIRCSSQQSAASSQNDEWEAEPRQGWASFDNSEKGVNAFFIKRKMGE